MLTQNIVLDTRWRYLEGTENGCLIQTQAGVEVYYVYSDTAPDPEYIGFTEDQQEGPTRLRGGNIWVRSKNWSRISFMPYDVDAESIDVIVGDIDNLPNNTNNVVEAILYLEDLSQTLNNEKQDKEEVGDTSIDYVQLFEDSLT